MTDTEKWKTFKKHYTAAYGKIWNDDDAADLYEQFVKGRDIERIVQCIWLIAGRQEKRPKLGDIYREYKQLERRENEERTLVIDEWVPPDCPKCKNEGWAWVIMCGVPDLYPCGCHHGTKILPKKFGKDFKMMGIVTELELAYKHGCFHSKEAAEEFIAKRKDIDWDKEKNAN